MVNPQAPSWIDWIARHWRCSDGRVPWTNPIAQLTPKHLPLAGAKAVTLGRMIRGGLSVPEGFVLTTATFQRFVESVPEWKGIHLRLTNVKRNEAMETRNYFLSFKSFQQPQQQP